MVYNGVEQTDYTTPLHNRWMIKGSERRRFIESKLISYVIPDRPRLMDHPCPFIRSVIPFYLTSGALIFQGSKDLFTDHAITIWSFPVLWPHLQGIANHFPIDHTSFHYSSSITLNSGVLNGYVTENVS